MADSARVHQDETLTISIRDGVMVATLNRTAYHNAINSDMARSVVSCFTTIPSQVRAAVIVGAGKSFCAGADLKERREMTPDELWVHGQLISSAFQAVSTSPVPVIAAVHGNCLGGGAELLTACDFAVASKNAKIGFPEVRLGIFPGAGGSVRLPALVPPAIARWLLYTGETITGEEAARIGLVVRAVDASRTESTAIEWATQIARNGPLAVKALKKVTRFAFEPALSASYEVSDSLRRPLNETEDAKEGARSFVEKRAPRFRGE